MRYALLKTLKFVITKSRFWPLFKYRPKYLIFLLFTIYRIKPQKNISARSGASWLEFRHDIGSLDGTLINHYGYMNTSPFEKMWFDGFRLKGLIEGLVSWIEGLVSWCLCFMCMYVRARVDFRVSFDVEKVSEQNPNTLTSWKISKGVNPSSVSYTHLTLPTILLV